MVSGIASVWFSRKENILVYPVGLVSTLIYIYLSFKGHLPGEAVVNIYYSLMSIWGWWLWARRKESADPGLRVSFSSPREVRNGFLFFLLSYFALYLFINLMKAKFYEAIPPADALASATAFTGMWLMARKKVESWYWWIATNIASIPLYAVKDLALTAVFYFILLVMAFWGLAAWKQKARASLPEEDVR